MPKVDSSLLSVGGNTQGVDSQSRASGAQSPNHPEPAVRDAIQRALIALGHQIDADTVRFFRDPDKDTTALAQLCDSLEAAFLALLASPALPASGSGMTEEREALLSYLESQKFHPQASHVPADFRDGYNHALNAVIERVRAEQELRSSPALPKGEGEEALTDAYAEDRRDEQEELASVLPGTTYMDPPDGGAPTILEQLQRQARDAARYLWLRNHGLKYANVGLGTTCEGVDVVDFSPTFTIPEPVGMRYEDNEWTLDDLDAAIDAAMSPKSGEQA